MRAVHRRESVDNEPEVPGAQLEQRLQLQRDVLEMIAVGRGGREILDQLCLLSEAIVADSVCSIMLLVDTRSHLDVRSAASIPAEGIEALNGLQPGPCAGSCGTAMYTREPVFVENILTNPRWREFLEIADGFNLRACWSVPIKAANDQVQGSFALTSFETRPPGPFHKRLLDTGSYLAGIVLERERQAQRLLTAGIAFEHMREAVMVTDAEHRIIQANKAFERITGYSADEVIGQKPRLRSAVHEDDTLARLGGDELVVLLEGIKDANVSRRIANRIIERLSDPLSVRGKSLVIAASIGISLDPDDGQDMATLLKNADAAMYQAKILIDRSFVGNLPDDAAIVKAVILMAHTLGLEVVAEGLETREQHRFLCRCGCDHLEGFLYGKPMPAEEIGRLPADKQLRITEPCIQQPKACQ